MLLWHLSKQERIRNRDFSSMWQHGRRRELCQWTGDSSFDGELEISLSGSDQWNLYESDAARIQLSELAAVYWRVRDRETRTHPVLPFQVPMLQRLLPMSQRSPADQWTMSKHWNRFQRAVHFWSSDDLQLLIDPCLFRSWSTTSASP